MNSKLTTHFYLDEFLQSQSASRLGIDNTPDDDIIQNLVSTALLLECIRVILGAPIIITSGYRCKELNTAIGGANNSAHIRGLAADFISPVFGSPLDICEEIEAHIGDLAIDQLIFEHTWVHVGIIAPISSCRRQILTYHPGQNPAYTVGLTV